jgi:hypothetical protein
MSSVTLYRKAPQIDKLYRISSEPGNNKAEIRFFCETSSVVSVIRNLFQENNVLLNMVGNLWKTHQYNQEYISYLLGNYTEEEFMVIANSYAEPLQTDISNEYLSIASNVLFKAIDQTLTSSDLSIFLNLDIGVIDSKMSVLNYIPSDPERE